MESSRLFNAGVVGSPRDLPKCDVWPEERAHLLEEGYDYKVVAAMVKTGHNMSDALLKFHYPTLYENPMVLFCDTGDHIVIYIATKVDKPAAL